VQQAGRDCGCRPGSHDGGVERTDNVVGKAQRRVNTIEGRQQTITEMAGARFVEITHEALFRHWERARVWLEEDRDFLSWRRRLTEEQISWRNSPNQEFLALLTGNRLSQAMFWLERKRDLLDRDDIQFIEVSAAVDEIDIRDRSKERTMTRLSIAIAAGCILFAMFVWYLSIS
jgi:hypothetical protein